MRTRIAAAGLAVAVVVLLIGCQTASVGPTANTTAGVSLTPTVENTPRTSITPSPATPDAATPRPSFGPAVDRAFDLQLPITTHAQEYAAGQPINAIAELAYIGNGTGVQISSLTNGPVGFGIAQLDGPIHMEPTWGLQCVDGPTITSDKPLRLQFTKTGSFSRADPNVGWYEAFIADPGLKLTPGHWLIYAKADAGPNGSRCEDWTLQASTEVAVN